MRSVRVITILTLVVVAGLTAAVAPARAGARLWQPRLAAGAGSPGVLASVRPPRAAYVPGEVLVEFKAGVSGARRRAVALGAASVVSRSLPARDAAPGRTLVLISSGTRSTRQLQRSFSADPAVAAVSPNYIRYVDAIPPDDPGLPGQWGIEAIHAGDAWQMTTGSEDVVIADIDTGVDLLHPDLAGNLWTNPGEVPGNRIDDDGNGYVDDVYGIDAAYGDAVPMDDDGHGTHTSGIAAARGGNGAGIAGTGWRTRIMALKFITYWGGGTDAGAIECIDYAVRQKLDHGVNVVAINASWGGGSPNVFLRDAVERAGDAGIVFVASAGNDGSNNDRTPHYPSSFDCDTIISVAATEAGGRLADFSCFGRLSVDIAAPGEDVLSCIAGGGYERWSGTSMAAPFVSGTVALCAALHPDETAEQRVARVLAAARPAAAVASKVRSGGTLDAAAALGVGGGDDDVTPPVTTALGGDASVYDVAVPIALFATDGAGGSGVAGTEWRLDGGPWRAGTTCVVPAPRHARRARVVEYRSVDRAGNAEAPKRLSITFDTTAGPGAVRPLPPSPVSGGVSGSSDDTYTVRLRAGETLSVTSDGLSASSIAVLVSTAKPKPRLVDLWLPSRAATFAFVAPADARYVLSVSPFESWRPGSELYRFTYRVVPAGVDVVPPSAEVTGLGKTWHNAPVDGEIVAEDGVGGSGVARAEQSADDGLSWVTGAHVHLDAPADHSDDGYHFLRYRAVDVAGNVGATEMKVIGIDTRGPVTQAWGPDQPVARGHRTVIRFRIDDLAPKVRDCRLLVRSVRTGALACVKRLGTKPTADALWWTPGHRHGAAVTCRWAPGVYSVRIVATDLAGNRAHETRCERLLVVR